MIKIGSQIINLSNVCNVWLDWVDEHEQKAGVAIGMVDSSTLFFWDEEAAILRWYFSHQCSKVIDIKNLSGM